MASCCAAAFIAAKWAGPMGKEPAALDGRPAADSSLSQYAVSAPTCSRKRRTFCRMAEANPPTAAAFALKRGGTMSPPTRSSKTTSPGEMALWTLSRGKSLPTGGWRTTGLRERTCEEPVTPEMGWSMAKDLGSRNFPREIRPLASGVCGKELALGLSTWEDGARPGEARFGGGPGPPRQRST